jgi:hypothetical protein
MPKESLQTLKGRIWCFDNPIFIGPSEAAPSIRAGSGTPEGVVTAPIGSLFLNTAGGVSTTLYVKTSGSGNTGWTAK